MRIHTNRANYDTIAAATVYASGKGQGRVFIDEASSHGSKSHNGAYEVKLVGDGSHSKRLINSGKHGAGEEYAPTWDQWGWFLAYLYASEPGIKCAGWYNGATEFLVKTGGKYPIDQVRMGV